jgi:hypothetical protein
MMDYLLLLKGLGHEMNIFLKVCFILKGHSEYALLVFTIFCYFVVETIKSTF